MYGVRFVHVKYKEPFVYDVIVVVIFEIKSLCNLKEEHQVFVIFMCCIFVSSERLSCLWYVWLLHTISSVE